MALCPCGVFLCVSSGFRFHSIYPMVLHFFHVIRRKVHCQTTAKHWTHLYFSIPKITLILRNSTVNGGGYFQDAQERQEKRQQAKAERFRTEEGQGRQTEEEATAMRETSEEAGSMSGANGGRKHSKKALGCNTCGLTFADTVRRFYSLLASAPSGYVHSWEGVTPRLRHVDHAKQS